MFIGWELTTPFMLFSSHDASHSAVTLASWQTFDFELISGHHHVQFERQLVFALVVLSSYCYTVLTRPNQVQTAVNGCILAFSSCSLVSLSHFGSQSFPAYSFIKLTPNWGYASCTAEKICPQRINIHTSIYISQFWLKESTETKHDR